MNFSSYLFLAVTLVLLSSGRESVAFQAAAAPQPTAQERQAEQFVAQAKLHWPRAEWDLAIAACGKAIEVAPAWLPGYVARGMSFNGKGEYDNAIKDFDHVTAQPGRDTAAVAIRADAFANRSLSFYHKREYLKAIDSAYFAVLEKGDHPEAHLYRAMAYNARNQHDKAINSLYRAIEISKNSAEAYSQRGLAFAGKGNFDQALADHKKAIELAPQMAAAYQRRAAAHLGKKDLDSARKDIDQALALNPNFADALCDRAYLHALKKDMPKALADLDAAIRANPSYAKAHFQRGLALLEKGEEDPAIASFDEAIRLQSDHAGAFCFRGYAHLGKKDFQPAVDDFTKAIGLDGKLAKAYYGRNQAYRKLGKTTEAVADLNKSKELEPPSPPKTAAKKPAAKKKEAPLPPRFLVESTPVAPAKRASALKSAKEIDRLVAANYTKHKVTPNEKTTDEQFVRRIYLDITGTIPTYAQTKLFLGSPDADKRAALIDELLGSDGYASHYFNYWADVLRYTDNLNGNVRGEPYRQWIKQSLAENKPWDKLVHELMTAEGLVWQKPATGYLQRDANMPLDNMNNTVRIFLGTRIGCAQCHNHPFDRWTQKEFYQMAAFTFGALTSTGGGDTRYWNKNPNDRLAEEYSQIDQEEEDRRNNYYRFNRLIGINMMIVNDQKDRKITLPKDYAYDDAKPNDIIEPKTLFGASADVRPDEPPRHAFSRWLTSKDNPRFALTIANRLWKQAFGVGQIEPVDDMMDSTVAENPELMKFLEAEMKRLDFDMKEYLRIIFNSQTYQRQACSEEIALGAPYHFQGPMLRRMTAEQVWDSFLTLAVVKPDEYREVPANLRTDHIGVDLNTVAAPQLLEADNMGNQVDGAQGTRQAKYVYKGVLLARASELPSPVPANHFLRMFGQSDRELISASSTTGSVPQVLFMFNGPITHMLLEKNSTIYNNVVRKKTDSDRIRTVFLTILSRDPDSEEATLAAAEVKQAGAAGYGNVIWSLVNTREFLFIQ